MQLFLIILHVILGIGVAYAPVFVSYYCVLILLYGVVDVIRTRDLDLKAGYYALYFVGMEVPYRMGKYILAYEMGKYLSITIIIVGLVFGLRKRIPLIFIFLLLLLIPAIFLTDGYDLTEVRKSIMFNISGPLSLVFSGLYFFGNDTPLNKHVDGLKHAFLPAITTITAISLKAGLGDIDFSSISSNTAAAGGFGANQVSTVLGYFIVLFFLLKLKGQKIFYYDWIDYGFLSLMVLRGLLTFSRGGILGAVISITLVVLVGLYYDRFFRLSFVRKIPLVLFGLFFVVAAALYANKITNNYLLYRYMGLRTNEVLTGQRIESGGFLTGRDKIIKGDIEAFKSYPLFGVGYGMAVVYHAKYYGAAMAAHTEYARLLSENGVMGLLFNVIAFLLVPISFWITRNSLDSRLFFTAFFLLSIMIMFHSAMRLALPGIIYGLAFLRLLDDTKTSTRKDL